MKYHNRRQKFENVLPRLRLFSSPLANHEDFTGTSQPTPVVLFSPPSRKGVTHTNQRKIAPSSPRKVELPLSNRAVNPKSQEKSVKKNIDSVTLCLQVFIHSPTLPFFFIEFS
jgi:hypothetical protein